MAIHAGSIVTVTKTATQRYADRTYLVEFWNLGTDRQDEALVSKVGSGYECWYSHRFGTWNATRSDAIAALLRSAGYTVDIDGNVY